MMPHEKIAADRWLTLCSALYLTAPAALFALGWLRPIVAFPAAFLFLYFTRLLTQSVDLSPSEGEGSARWFWVSTVVLVVLWVLLSGIGGFAFQNSDFMARNPMYRDLCDRPWPVIYDLSQGSEAARRILGSGTAAFAYYFSWWLPPALVSKVLSLGQTGRDICLALWAALGLLLTVHHLTRYLGRRSFLISVLFILFSGLDAAGFYLARGYIPFQEHMEWWGRSFQFSANTTQLFWVFNQSIGTWLIMALLLRLRDGKNVLALGSLTFAYSPWAAMGILPIALNAVLARGRRLRDTLTPQNLLVPMAMLLVYGVFYLGSSGMGISRTGWTLPWWTWGPHWIRYAQFVLLEFGLYFILMGPSIRTYPFYWVVLTELLLLPMYRIISVDFIMRASIPALFCLMVYVLKFLLEERGRWEQKALLALALLIGAWTPMTEINRSVLWTTLHHMANGFLGPGAEDLYRFAGVREERPRAVMRAVVERIAQSPILKDQVYSFGEAKIADRGWLNGIKTHFLMYDYENSIFFKYLARRN